MDKKGTVLSVTGDRTILGPHLQEFAICQASLESSYQSGSQQEFHPELLSHSLTLSFLSEEAAFQQKRICPALTFFLP